MLTNDELNLYKALYALVGTEKNHKVLELDEIVQSVKSIDENFEVEKIHDIISDFKNKDLIDLKYFTPDAFCLLTKKDLNELIAEISVLRKAAEITTEQPVEKKFKVKEKHKLKQSDEKIVEPIIKEKVNTTNASPFNYNFITSLVGGLLGSIITGIIFIILFFTLKR